MMWIKLKRKRLYNGIWYEAGSILKMDSRYARAFLRAGVAIAVPAPKEEVLNRTVQSTIPVEEEETFAEEEAEDFIYDEEENNEIDEEEIDAKYLEGLTYRELKNLCEMHELATSGKKKELRERLLKYFV